MGIWRRVLSFFGLANSAGREEAAVREIRDWQREKTIRTDEPAVEEAPGAMSDRPEKKEVQIQRPQPIKRSAAPPVRAAAPKTEIKLTIGLDFGTSTVKCIVFAQIGDRRLPERFVLPIDGLALFPAICWERDGELFIGKRPPEADREFRSPKACLRCEILDEEYPDTTYKESGCPPSAISWAILSYCVDRIRNQILERFPADSYVFDWRRNVYWNMGAPLDGMKHEHLRRYFAGLLWLSVNHGFEWSAQSTPSAGLSGLYEKVMRSYPPPLEDSDGFVNANNCFVFPEAHVAVNAFLLLGGNLDDGLYFTCDVGAGTTDIAFFRYARAGERPVIFYDTSSTFAGGDDIVRALSKIMGEDPEASNQRLIQGLTNEELACLSASLEILRKKITEGRHRAFGQAYSKEREMEVWKREMRGAAVLGGGSRLADIRRHCVRPLRTGMGGETIRVVDIPLRRAMPPNATEIHSIAFGLSIPPTQFYSHWRPDEVESFKPPAREQYDPFPGGNPYDK